ncbi:MAG: cyclic nucleotide-binding domain-containing protein [Spirochaetales bacterium]|nr:cyclic nucleotide-binding domain-containing protein [Spirochaetales bacterium]
MVDLKSLHNHSLFGGITEDQISSIRQFFVVEDFAEGEFIEREGEAGDRIYFIIEGQVEILKKITKTGNLSRIFMFSEGDVFGEMELIDVQPCAASVRALKPTKALTLSNKGLYQISKYDLKVFSLMIMNLARDISRRLRKVDEIIALCPEINKLKE